MQIFIFVFIVDLETEYSCVINWNLMTWGNQNQSNSSLSEGNFNEDILKCNHEENNTRRSESWEWTGKELTFLKQW